MAVIVPVSSPKIFYMKA